MKKNYYLLVLICLLFCFSCCKNEIDSISSNLIEGELNATEVIEEMEEKNDIDESKLTKVIYYTYDVDNYELLLSVEETDEYCNKTTFSEFPDLGGKLGYIRTVTFVKGNDKFYPDTLHDAFTFPDMGYIKGFENVDTSYVKDFSYCFYGFQYMDNTILDNLKMDSGENFSHMFSCTNIKSFDARNYNFSKANNFEYMFEMCSDLVNANFSNGNFQNVVSAKGMFCMCNGLENIDLSNSNFNNCEDLYAFFGYCFSLVDINFNNSIFNNVKNMDYIFDSCKLLEIIDISSFDLSGFEGISTSIGKNKIPKTFCGNCENLKTIYLPESFNKDYLDYKYFFPNCPLLENIYYKNNNGDLTPLLSIEK